jgi:hypothetical protein
MSTFVSRTYRPFTLSVALALAAADLVFAADDVPNSPIRPTIRSVVRRLSA